MLATRLISVLYFIYTTQVIFKEVLRPPIWVLAFIYFLFLSLVLAVWAAFDSRTTWISLALSTIALVVVARSLRSEISIDETSLFIDKAHIDRKYLGKVLVLDNSALRNIRTRDADPAAYLAIRFWMTKGVRIDLNDVRDKTPYWLITSKRGEEIAALLNKKSPPD